MHLRGLVEAERFVEGAEHQVVQSSVALHEAPSTTSRRETELLFGETFRVFDVSDGFAWGQAIADSYVGYLEAAALAAPPLAPTHRVTAARTITFSAPDIKSAPVLFLSLNAKITVEERVDNFVRIARGGFAFAHHTAPADHTAHDFVAFAELFLETPYLWGGKSGHGIDCSGLVQAALECVAINAPRDADMQEAELGSPLPIDNLANLRRGDLVFWEGHVGILLDNERLLHASARHMKVAIEPLSEALAHGERGPITSIKRLALPG
jgi:cell wall-associated NlpC family hydrolase